MKTTYRFIIAALAAAVALSSCTKDIAADREDVNPQDGVRTIAISFDNQTKTVLGGPDGLTPQFKADGTEEIIVSNNKSWEKLKVMNDGNGAYIKTKLSGTLTAVYPSKYAKVDGVAIKGVIVPSNQTGRFEDANIAMTKIGEGATSATFKNQTAILRFYVDESIGVVGIRVKEMSGNCVSDGLISETGEVVESEYDEEAGAEVNYRTFITVDYGRDSLLAEKTDDPNKRICYVAVRPNDQEVKSYDLSVTSLTTTQDYEDENIRKRTAPAKGGVYPVRRNFPKVSLSASTMANVFIPYYIKVDVGETTPEYQRWSYCNLGAFLPEEPGEYFMWGYTVGHTANTTGKDAFSGQTFKQDETRGDDSKGFAWDNYIKFTSSTYSSTNKTVFTKYVPFDKAATYGDGGTFYDDKTTLDLADDAANANWGGAWRMPTKAEFDALSDGSWDVSNKGYTFGTSHKIFLPAVDCGDGVDLENVGAYGYYWSSSLSGTNDNPYYAYCFNFLSSEADTYISFRCYGMPIRPIYGAPAAEGTSVDIESIDPLHEGRILY